MRNDTPEPRLAALRYRDFRLLWLGQLVSQMGTQMQFIAVNWHVYRLLRDESYTLSLFGRTIELGVEAMGLGVLGLVRVLPVMLFALVGGMLADTRDRRLLLIQTQLVAAVLALVLASINEVEYKSITGAKFRVDAGSADLLRYTRGAKVEAEGRHVLREGAS